MNRMFRRLAATHSFLVLLGWAGSVSAANEALQLSPITPALAGGTTTTSIGIDNVEDMEGFALELSFNSGATLTTDESKFARGADFLPVNFPNEQSPLAPLNKLTVTAGKNKLYISGFKPTGVTGNVGTVTFNVDPAALAGVAPYDTPEKQPSSQVVTLTGKFFSKSQQKVVTLAPVTQLFTVGTPASSYNLTVSIFGSGTVNSVPAGFTCAGGSCSTSYPGGEPLQLVATGSNSVFSGWSGDCSGANCSLVMNGDKTVTATFATFPPVRIGGATPVYHTPATLQNTYDKAAHGAVIEVRGGALGATDTLTANDLTGKTVKLKGGYDSSFTNSSGATTISGPLKITRGKVILERIKVR